MPKPSKDKDRFAKVFEILQQNQQKDFVQRILDPNNAPALVEPDGKTFRTHRMATAEADGVHYVFPTILKNDFGELEQHESKKAFEIALQKGEAIGFKTAKEADWFERNWKVAWGHPPRRGK